MAIATGMPMKRLMAAAMIAIGEEASNSYGAVRPRARSRPAASRAMNGARRSRPTMAAQVRSGRCVLAHPSGSSPRVIVRVNRGGRRSRCALIEIHSPMCCLIQLTADPLSRAYVRGVSCFGPSGAFGATSPFTWGGVSPGSPPHYIGRRFSSVGPSGAFGATSPLHGGEFLKGRLPQYIGRGFLQVGPSGAFGATSPLRGEEFFKATYPLHVKEFFLTLA